MNKITSNIGIDPLDISLGDIIPSTNYKRHWIELGNGKVTTGMQKLANRFIITFLNVLGSTKHDSDFGTELLPGILVGSSMNFGVLQSHVAIAVSDAKHQILSDDRLQVYSDNPPNEELLDTVSCDSVEYNVKTGTIKIYVSLTNMAGESYTYALPVDLAFSV